MPSLFKNIFFISLILFFCVPCIFAAEEIILTTYYPSPYGSYNYLQTDKMGVGDNNEDSAFTSADVPTTTGDVWIKGKVGIGTANPAGKLDISGGILALDNGDYGSSRGIRFRNTTDTTTPSGGGIVQANNNNLYVQAGSGRMIWFQDGSGVTMGGFGYGDYLWLKEATKILPANSNSTTALQIADYSRNPYVNFDSSNLRIGIGTTGPVAKLHIYSDGSWQSGLRLEWNGNGGNGWNFAHGTDGGLYIGYGSASSLTTSMVIASSGNIGMGTGAPGTHRLSVVGTAGLSTGTAWTSTSDRRWKDVKNELKGSSLSKVLSLRPIAYTWNELHNQQFGQNPGLKYGFIAQEVEGIFPDMISKDEKGFYWYNPSGMEAVLTAAIQEQQDTIKAQQLEIDALKARLDKLEEKHAQAI